jgi:predicted DNA-binding WGR domain protein
MRYAIGDCLSFEVSPGKYLSGFLSDNSHGKYQIALSAYRRTSPPAPAYFDNCEVFGVRYEGSGTSVSTLDVIVMEPDFVDNSKNIELISHLELPVFLSASGFKEISNFSDLAAFFEVSMTLREELNQVFEVRCFINVNDFLKTIQPANSFPNVTLYKDEKGSIFYWLIYGNSNDPAYLVIHWGKLGENGEYIEMKDRSLTSLKQVYQSEIRAKKHEGYRDDFTMNRMILQFPVGDGWGNTDDLAFRNEIWDYLDRFLFWSGNGKITGGDIGSGTIILFFEAVLPELSIDIITQALQEKKIERPYLIALEEPEEEVLGDSVGVKIVYPKHFKGEFFY